MGWGYVALGSGSGPGGTHPACWTSQVTRAPRARSGPRARTCSSTRCARRMAARHPQDARWRPRRAPARASATGGSSASCSGCRTCAAWPGPMPVERIHERPVLLLEGVRGRAPVRVRGPAARGLPVPGAWPSPWPRPWRRSTAAASSTRTSSPPTSSSTPSGEARLIDFGVATLQQVEHVDAAPTPPHRGHAGVHVARADRADEPGGGLPHGLLLAGRHVLRAAHGRAALPGAGRARVVPRAHGAGAHAAARARCPRCRRPCRPSC